MPIVGLITEGPTDFQVLRLFLTGLCGSDFVITPLSPVAQADGSYPPTGWRRVLEFIANPEFEDALNNVDFVVVHLDSDSCELFNPSITHVSGAEEEVIHEIKQRLVQEMEEIVPHFWADRSDQILFAIAVRSTECWLLPLFYTDKMRLRTENCLKMLNDKRKRHNFSIDKKQKQFGYRKLLQLDELKPRNLKRDKVLDISQHNVGFADFAEQALTLICPPPTTTVSTATVLTTVEENIHE